MKKIIILLMAMMSFVQYGFCISDTFEIELDDRKWEAMYPMLPHHDVIFLVPENSENEFICITEFFDKVDFGTGRESCLQIFMPDKDAFLHTEKVPMNRRTYYVWYHCPNSSITEEQKAKWAERFKDGYVCDPAKTVTINKDGAFMGGKALTKEWKYVKVAHPTENYTIDLPEGIKVFPFNDILKMRRSYDFDQRMRAKYSLTAARMDQALSVVLCVVPSPTSKAFFNQRLREKALLECTSNAQYVASYDYETKKGIVCWYTRVIDSEGYEHVNVYIPGKFKVYSLELNFRHQNYEALSPVLGNIIESFEEHDSKTMAGLRNECMTPEMGSTLIQTDSGKEFLIVSDKKKNVIVTDEGKKNEREIRGDGMDRMD